MYDVRVRLARVFPSRTKATPTDELCFFGPPGFFPPEVDEVHVSVTFTWDISYAKKLAVEWADVAPVKIGGPAMGTPGGQFVADRYLKTGYTITSRGCRNRCWYCSAWKRDGDTKEYEIVPGWNVQDDNLLACSEKHIRSVFSMLSKQKKRAEFTGGLEAKLLRPWHVELLSALRPNQMFFAYDTPDDLGPLKKAAAMLTSAGFTRNQMRCYVLIGYPKDTLGGAEERLESVMRLRFCAMAMLWRDDAGSPKNPGWARFQRNWASPCIIHQRRGGLWPVKED